jgi:hypothetical protein
LAAVLCPACRLEAAAQASTPKIRIGVSTYSYWHFDKVKYPIEKVIENAAKIGFDGVEILHRQMENETPKVRQQPETDGVFAWDWICSSFRSIRTSFRPTKPNARNTLTTPNAALIWR